MLHVLDDDMLEEVDDVRMVDVVEEVEVTPGFYSGKKLLILQKNFLLHHEVPENLNSDLNGDNTSFYTDL